MKTPSSFRVLRCVSILSLLTTVAACSSTPQHTNTLIFGTSTRFALDVSQNPTGTLGVTFGYKREEAVWMPLLPNQSQGGASTAQPATCAEAKLCPKFEGTGSSGNDTYSVLATFGGSATGNSSFQNRDVNAGASIAQFFATGLAARALADRGGAALVNTHAQGSVDAVVREAAVARVAVTLNMIDQISALVQANDELSVDSTKLQKAFAEKPGADISKSTRDDILTSKTLAELKDALRYQSEKFVIKPMLESLQIPAPQMRSKQ